jgi:hypothetical protein
VKEYSTLVGVKNILWLHDTVLYCSDRRGLARVLNQHRGCTIMMGMPTCKRLVDEGHEFLTFRTRETEMEHLRGGCLAFRVSLTVVDQEARGLQSPLGDDDSAPRPPPLVGCLDEDDGFRLLLRFRSFFALAASNAASSMSSIEKPCFKSSSSRFSSDRRSSLPCRRSGRYSSKKSRLNLVRR